MSREKSVVRYKAKKVNSASPKVVLLRYVSRRVQACKGRTDDSDTMFAKLAQLIAGLET